MIKYYRHKEDRGLIIRILQDNANTISVCGNDTNATVFHLTREELDFNFEQLERSDPACELVNTAQETKT